jgi:molecular chaperone GrpE
VTERKRAGEPDTSRGVAGAPASPSGPAGAPPSEPAAPEPRPEEQPGAEREGDAVQHDIDELLAEARKERDEYLELAQRTKADFENYRRRASREASEAERRARAGLARELVPVLDNLERALRAAQIDPDAAEAGDGDGAGLAHGVLLVYRDLRATIERAGVETYDPVGEKFDPEWHEALSTRPAEGAESGTVVETVEKGYRLDGQVLRPARVVVSE